MNSKFVLSIAAVLALSSVALVPAASAGLTRPDVGDENVQIAPPTCEPTDPAYRRAICAAYDVAAGVIRVADPVVLFAKQEKAWAEQQVDVWLVFVNEQVAEACSHVTGLCETLEAVETTTLLA